MHAITPKTSQKLKMKLCGVCVCMVGKGGGGGGGSAAGSEKVGKEHDSCSS